MCSGVGRSLGPPAPMRGRVYRTPWAPAQGRSTGKCSRKDAENAKIIVLSLCVLCAFARMICAGQVQRPTNVRKSPPWLRAAPEHRSSIHFGHTCGNPGEAAPWILKQVQDDGWSQNRVPGLTRSLGSRAWAMSGLRLKAGARYAHQKKRAAPARAKTALHLSAKTALSKRAPWA